LVNSAPLSEAMREKYLAEGAVQVEFLSGLRPPDELQSANSFRLICAELLNQDGLARHDPHKLARALIDLHTCESSPACEIEVSH
ncbi:MAG TPA: hypothetical protein VID27_14990, partial [Blastocatellia bacterium]